MGHRCSCREARPSPVISRLDDSASWMGITDHVMSHGRSLADLPPSTYRAAARRVCERPAIHSARSCCSESVTRSPRSTPRGSTSPTWRAVRAAVGLGVYALTEGVVRSPRLRALVAFFAAQPALLYGYAMWGGIKELTAAFRARARSRSARASGRGRSASPRRLLPLAVAAAALIVTLGVGAAGWVLPALACVVIVWVLRGWRARQMARWHVISECSALVTAVLAIPMWVVLSSFLGSDGTLFTSGQSVSEKLETCFSR